MEGWTTSDLLQPGDEPQLGHATDCPLRSNWEPTSSAFAELRTNTAVLSNSWPQTQEKSRSSWPCCAPILAQTVPHQDFCTSAHCLIFNLIQSHPSMFSAAESEGQPHSWGSTCMSSLSVPCFQLQNKQLLINSLSAEN